MSDSKSPDQIPLMLFAKAPVVGKVKTRLHPPCSLEEAATVAAWLIEASLENVCQFWPGQVLLSVSGNIKLPFFQRLVDRFGVILVEQADGDLGQRMQAAFDSTGYPAAIMGCDIPHCSADTLRRLYKFLSAGESAIAPSVDGGYYLIGLSVPMTELFCSMPWGKSAVYARTKQAALQNQYILHELTTLQDIDTWDDLVTIVEQRPEFGVKLARLGLRFP